MENNQNTDFEERIKNIREEAEKGDALSQYKLGIYYVNYGTGDGYMDTAINWLEKAGEQGYAEAYEVLGEIYEEGDDGFEANPELAFINYKKSADLGSDIAQTNLGLCYENAIGTEKNLQEAIKCYEKAAEKENAQALYCLGNIYLTGYGVQYDKKKAKEFYQRAAKKGHPMAKLYFMKKNGVKWIMMFLLAMLCLFFIPSPVNCYFGSAITIINLVMIYFDIKKIKPNNLKNSKH